MTDPDLPQPIYPPSGGTGAGGGGTGGGTWATPPVPPGMPPAPPVGPAHQGGHPPAGPPAGGGYGFGGSTPQPQGPTPSKPGLSTGHIVAIIAAVVLVVGGIVGVIISRDGDGDGGGNASSSQSDGGGGSKRGDGGGDNGGGSGGDNGGGGNGGGGTTDDTIDEVIGIYFVGFSGGTQDCVATELEGAPELVEAFSDPSFAGLYDYDLAGQYGSILAGCADPQELSDLFEADLAAQPETAYAAECIASQTESFGTAQWEEFLATYINPNEESYLYELVAEMGSDC